MRTNMEEDLKILEEFVRNYKEVQEKYKDDEIQAEIERGCYFEEVPARAIENLIKGYKELEEELRPIKNIEKALDEMDIEGIWNDIKAEDYIPKSKVREIIEDIDNSQPVIAELKLRKLVEGDK